MGLAKRDASVRAGRISASDDRETIRLGSLCRLAAADAYHVISSDGEEVGTVVGVGSSGPRAVSDQIWLRRQSTRNVEVLPLTDVAAVDAADHVLVLAVDEKTVNRRRFHIVA